MSAASSAGGGGYGGGGGLRDRGGGGDGRWRRWGSGGGSHNQPNQHNQPQSGWNRYIRNANGHLFFELADTNLCDSDLGEALVHFRDHLTYSAEFDIDLSVNPISDAGVIAHLVPFLAEYPQCRRMKLFRTSIGDVALRALRGWIRLGHARELHLSDLRGRVTGDAVFQLLEDVCSCQRYPFRNGQEQQYSALWLRLENNKITDTEALVRRCIAGGMYVQVLDEAAMIRMRPFGVGKKGSWYVTPAVHLVYFHSQWSSSHEASSSHERFRSEQRWGDHAHWWSGYGSEHAQADVQQGTQRESSLHVGEDSELASAETNPFASMTESPDPACIAWLGASVGPRVREHVPCLLKEAVNAMFPPRMQVPGGKYNGTYVDCTFGRGGHSREILSRLSPSGRLFAFDVDPDAVVVAKELERQDARFHFFHKPFGEIGDVFDDGGFDGGRVHGVLLDLGVSSPQLDDRRRGFNLYEDVPLDMRMNPGVGVPAWQWLEDLTVEKLAWVIHAYGEDDDYLLSERIASALVASLPTRGRMLTCKHAADIVSTVVRTGGYIRPMHRAKLTFQSIRVHLNQEMQQLDSALNGAFRALEPNGHCSVISFKRMESARILKFVRQREEPDASLRQLPDHRLCEMFPLLMTDVPYTVRHVGEPIKPTPAEVQNNNRCRSSILHLLRKERRVSSCLPVSLRQQLQLRPVGDRMVPPDAPPFRGA